NPDALFVGGDARLDSDVFVAKLDPLGSSLLYSTYLGGGRDDRSTGIVVDTNHNAYLTGTTASGNFPTVSPIQSDKSWHDDAFVVKLNDAGGPDFATYFGGLGNDMSGGIALDSFGDVVVEGTTDSDFEFPNLPNIPPTVVGRAGYLAVLNATGSA